MTGTSWKLLNQHFPLLVPAILERTVVMGRLSSDQKQQVVIQLQALDYHVGKLIHIKFESNIYI